jgi:uncharacterized protein (DUF849 family)
MTRHVPLTPERICEDVLQCAAAGASIIHLHAREPDGTAAWSALRYMPIIERIRARAPELILVVSTSGRTNATFEQRSNVLTLPAKIRTEMASLTLGSLNFLRDASCNHPEMIESLAARMAEQGIKPELEVFDLGMVNVAHHLIKRGLISPPYYFNIHLGNLATAQAKASHLGAIVTELPQDSVWSVGGIGDYQSRSILYGIAEGHGVRVGIEDNIWLNPERSQLATNFDLVTMVCSVSRAIGRPISTPEQTRALLGLSR